jgi:hypothetical protein
MMQAYPVFFGVCHLIHLFSELLTPRRARVAPGQSCAELVLFIYHEENNCHGRIKD